MAYVIKNGKTNLKQEAHIHQPTACLASTSRLRTAISPGKWQLWTAVSPLLRLISMTRPSGQWMGETRVSKTRLLPRRVKITPLSASSTPRQWVGVCVPLALIKFVFIKNNSLFSNACLKKCNISHSFVCLEGRLNHR